MLSNYVKLAFRHLRKRKGYALINIVGLAVGMACCVLITLFVQHELRYDRFHDNADRIQRAWVLEEYGPNERFFNTVTPLPLGPELEATYADIEASVRVTTVGGMIERDGTTFNEGVVLADPALWQVFDFELIQGDPATVFDQRDAVVLTEAAATRFFGDTDPVGQTLRMRIGDEFDDYMVRGVAAEVPSHSSIQFDVIVPFENGRRMWADRFWDQAWFNVFTETYLLLGQDTNPEALQTQFTDFVTTRLGDQTAPGEYQIGLQPLTDIHLNPDFPVGNAPVMDPAYLYILSAIALFILLIASINFVTLAVGQSAQRAMEVGVRKAMGARRSELMGQFWSEALLMTAFALILGLALAQLLLPLFNELAGQQLVLSLEPALVLIVVGLLLIVGAGAGSYPALVLSQFQPVTVLKGALPLSGDTGWFRRSLLVVQFGLSIFLVACTLIMGQQLSHLQQHNLGFDREHVVVLPTGMPSDEAMPIFERLRDELSTDPAVEAVTHAAQAFGRAWMNFGYDAEDGTYRTHRMNIVGVDYVKAHGMQIVAGRDFDAATPSDRAQGVIVNEAMVRAYGWEDPIGQRLPGASFGEHQIIGVVADFNYASLHNQVQPLALVQDRRAIFQGIANIGMPQGTSMKIVVRFAPGDLVANMAMLESTWATVAPGQDFAYTFLDEAVESQYRQEERLGRIVRIAALLSIFIACLGLLGLAALTVARRTKEIGIRKVLGASAQQIVALIGRDVLVLVGVAFLIAAPAAYWAMSNWLEAFAYRIDPGILTLVGAGVLTLIVAWVTVAFQSTRAALSDPVDTLRYE